MKKQILCLGVSSFMLLYLCDNAYPQEYKRNLHKTVTHGQSKAAISRNNGSKNTARETTAQESVMPGDLGRYAAEVKAFKTQFETNLVTKQDEADLGLHVRHGIKNWKEDDYVKLATSVNGAAHFYGLIVMSSAAIVKTYDGKPTEDAVCAQNALNSLKPSCCKDWHEFNDLIMKVRDQTNDKMMKIFRDFPEIRKGEFIYPDTRKLKGYSSVIEMHPEVKGGEATVFNFDEKKINAHLDALKTDKDNGRTVSVA